MTDPDRCDIEYGVLWSEGDIEPCASGAAADRALLCGGGDGVIIRRHVRTVYSDWETAR